MNTFKKIIGASAIALASLSVSASEINVGGVVWDPDWMDGGEQDFSMQYDFTQFFSTTSVAANDTAGMLTAYNTAEGINDVLSTLTGGAGSTGYYLSGTGESYRINGNNAFCPSCELTIAFGGLGLNLDGTYDASSAWISLYVDDSADYSHPLSNGAEINAAMDGNLWLSASFLSFGLTGGTVDNGLASANLQVNGGMASQNFLDSDLAGFMLQSGSAFFNTLTNAKYSGQGNGQVMSDTIPEPTSIAIFGLGLLGLAGAARRKQS